MTQQELERIKTLRQHNYPYRFIGEALSLPPNTVKSICRRKNFEPVGQRKTKSEKQNAPLCKNCHCLLTDGRKDRAFCSDECRSTWWKNNRKIIKIEP